MDVDQEKSQIRTYSEKSRDFLHKTGCPYIIQKNIISNFFTNKFKEENPEYLNIRLTVIDSYYSTNMSKRLYGIDELVNKLGKWSDSKLKKETIQFINEPNQDSEIYKIIYGGYGFSKESARKATKLEEIKRIRAVSLISKYLYFLTDYEFPIYDKLAIESQRMIIKDLKISSKRVEKCNVPTSIDYSYFMKMKDTKEYFEIETYDKLDNLLWLMGKISGKSYSLILSKNDYIKYSEELSKKDNSKIGYIFETIDYLNDMKRGS